eukprot:gene14765-20816_t
MGEDEGPQVPGLMPDTSETVVQAPEVLHGTDASALVHASLGTMNGNMARGDASARDSVDVAPGHSSAKPKAVATICPIFLPAAERKKLHLVEVAAQAKAQKELDAKVTSLAAAEAATIDLLCQEDNGEVDGSRVGVQAAVGQSKQESKQRQSRLSKQKQQATLKAKALDANQADANKSEGAVQVAGKKLKLKRGAPKAATASSSVAKEGLKKASSAPGDPLAACAVQGEAEAAAQSLPKAIPTAAAWLSEMNAAALTKIVPSDTASVKTDSTEKAGMKAATPLTAMDETASEKPPLVEIDLTKVDSSVTATTKPLEGSSPPAKAAAPVCAMFLPIADRKRLQQQELQKKREKLAEAEEAAGPSEEALLPSGVNATLLLDSDTLAGTAPVVSEALDAKEDSGSPRERRRASAPAGQAGATPVMPVASAPAEDKASGNPEGDQAGVTALPATSMFLPMQDRRRLMRELAAKDKAQRERDAKVTSLAAAETATIGLPCQEDNGEVDGSRVGVQAAVGQSKQESKQRQSRLSKPKQQATLKARALDADQADANKCDVQQSPLIEGLKKASSAPGDPLAVCAEQGDAEAAAPPLPKAIPTAAAWLSEMNAAALTKIVPSETASVKTDSTERDGMTTATPITAVDETASVKPPSAEIDLTKVDSSETATTKPLEGSLPPTKAAAPVCAIFLPIADRKRLQQQELQKKREKLAEAEEAAGISEEALLSSGVNATLLLDSDTVAGTAPVVSEALDAKGDSGSPREKRRASAPAGQAAVTTLIPVASAPAVDMPPGNPDGDQAGATVLPAASMFLPLQDRRRLMRETKLKAAKSCDKVPGEEEAHELDPKPKTMAANTRAPKQRKSSATLPEFECKVTLRCQGTAVCMDLALLPVPSETSAQKKRGRPRLSKPHLVSQGDAVLLSAAASADITLLKDDSVEMNEVVQDPGPAGQPGATPVMPVASAPAEDKASGNPEGGQVGATALPAASMFLPLKDRRRLMRETKLKAVKSSDEVPEQEEADLSDPKPKTLAANARAPKQRKSIVAHHATLPEFECKDGITNQECETGDTVLLSAAASADITLLVDDSVEINKVVQDPSLGVSKRLRTRQKSLKIGSDLDMEEPVKRAQRGRGRRSSAPAKNPSASKSVGEASSGRPQHSKKGSVESGPLIVDSSSDVEVMVDLTSDGPQVSGPQSKKTKSQGAEPQKPKGMVSAMFLPMHERKRQRQEQKMELERQLALQMEPASTVGADTGIEVVHIVGCTNMEVKFPSAIKQGPQLPLNPFFLPNGNRKRSSSDFLASSPAPGVSQSQGARASRAEESRKRLDSLLRSVNWHVRQLTTDPEAANLSYLNVSLQVNPDSSVALKLQFPVEFSSSRDQSALLPSTARAVHLPLSMVAQIADTCEPTLHLPRSEIDGWRFPLLPVELEQLKQDPAVELQSASATSLDCPPSLLQELARELEKEARASFSEHAELMDDFSEADILEQLQKERDLLLHRSRPLPSAPTASTLQGSGSDAVHDCSADQIRNGKQGQAWTVKYRPQQADQMCCNASSVQQLKTWLSEWKDRIDNLVDESGTESEFSGRNSGARGKGKGRRASCFDDLCEDDYFEDDCCGPLAWGDTDDEDVVIGRGAENALVLAGPVGSGKTAALQACALELGYNVIEVNPGQDRSGAQLARMIGEATQSRRLAHVNSKVNQSKAGGPSMPTTKPPTGLLGKNKKAEPGSDSKTANKKRSHASSIHCTPEAKKPRGGKGKAGRPRNAALVDDDDDDDVLEVADRETSQKSGQSIPPTASSSRHTLMLFEEADVLVDEDRGFASMLAALVQDSKRPIVICVNTPGAPPALAAIGVTVLRFQPPSEPDLIRLAALVCAAESEEQKRHQEVHDKGDHLESVDLISPVHSSVAVASPAPSHTAGGCSPGGRELRLEELKWIVRSAGADIRRTLNMAHFWSRGLKSNVPCVKFPVSSSPAEPGSSSMACGEGALADVASSMHKPGTFILDVHDMMVKTSMVNLGKLFPLWSLSRQASKVGALLDSDKAPGASCEHIPCSTGSTSTQALIARQLSLQQYEGQCEEAQIIRMTQIWHQAEPHRRALSKSKRGRKSLMAAGLLAPDGPNADAGGEEAVETSLRDVTATSLNAGAAPSDVAMLKSELVAKGANAGATTVLLVTTNAKVVTKEPLEEAGVDGDTAAPCLSGTPCLYGPPAMDSGLISAQDEAMEGGGLPEPSKTDPRCELDAVAAAALSSCEDEDDAMRVRVKGGDESHAMEGIAEMIGTPSVLPHEPTAGLEDLVLPLEPAALTGARKSVVPSEHPELMELMLLSEMHDQLSQCCILAGERDLVPPVGGPCPPARHHAVQQLGQALMPGQNTGAACSRGGFRNIACQGEVLRDMDGGDSANCFESLMEYESIGLDSGPTRVGTGQQCSISQLSAAAMGQILMHSMAGDTVIPGRSFQGVDSNSPIDGPEQSLGIKDPKLLSQRSGLLTGANNALLSLSLGSCAQGYHASCERLAWAARLCNLEVVRQEECKKMEKRKRVQWFEHYLEAKCPEVTDADIGTLLQLGAYGMFRV